MKNYRRKRPGYCPVSGYIVEKTILISETNPSYVYILSERATRDSYGEYRYGYRAVGRRRGNGRLIGTYNHPGTSVSKSLGFRRATPEEIAQAYGWADGYGPKGKVIP